jgi:hypothetical protein
VGVLLPKEHGAYGQLTLPLVTAIAAAGVSTAGLLLIAGAVAAFVAHESALILLGLRGTRARREHHGAAVRWLAAPTRQKRYRSRTYPLLPAYGLFP